jgi:hypothetical protein
MFANTTEICLGMFVDTRENSRLVQKSKLFFYHLSMTRISTFQYNVIPPGLVWQHTTKQSSKIDARLSIDSK